MILASLVAWMWMAAAQTHTQDCLWVHDGKAEHCEIGPIFVNPPKPAEHVIEIKTRRVSLIEITSYSEINGKLWACPVGSEMTSEVEGEPAGENTRWVTFCKVTKLRESEAK